MKVLRDSTIKKRQLGGKKKQKMLCKKKKKKLTKLEKTEKVIDMLLYDSCRVTAVQKLPRIFCEMANVRPGRLRTRKNESTLLIIRNGILSGRCKEIAPMLTSMSRTNISVDENIYRAGLIILNDSEYHSFREIFVKHFVKRNCPISPKEAILDHVMLLLQDGLVEEAQEAILTFTAQTRQRVATEIKKAFNLLLHGYEGLISYNLWLKLINSRKLQGDDVLNQSLLESSKMERYATQAINSFSFLLNDPGVWDIFICKYLHILVHQKNFEEAEEMLRENIRNNPNHCNAHVYLCEYLHHHDNSKHKQLKALKALQKIAPHHHLVLRFFNLCKNKKKYQAKCLRNLFIFLDYSSNSCNEEAWEMLVDYLKDILANIDVEMLNEVRECWNDRLNWWPKYHFNPNISPTDSRYELLYNKAAAASFLLPHNHGYWMKVRAILKENCFIQYKMLMKLVKKCSKRHKSEEIDNIRQMHSVTK